jgi:DNA-directed RNA polymerase specialized sigma24 family protein
MDWDDALRSLARWHLCRDDAAGREVFDFLQHELRRMVPPKTRHRWAESEVDDAIATLLKKLVEKPLSPEIRELKPYLARALRNVCVDVERARGRRREQLYDAADVPIDVEESLLSAVRSPEETIVERAQVESLLDGLLRLEIADRVALKLQLVPQALDAEELSWLAARNSTLISETLLQVQRATEVYDLTRIFDPGDDSPHDPAARRLRMERFRKRCARAREKLFGLLTKEDG